MNCSKKIKEEFVKEFRSRHIEKYGVKKSRGKKINFTLFNLIGNEGI